VTQSFDIDDEEDDLAREIEAELNENYED